MSLNTRLSGQPVMLLMTGNDAKWGRGHSSGSGYGILYVKEASGFTFDPNKLYKYQIQNINNLIITIFCGKVTVFCTESKSRYSDFGVGTIWIRLHHRHLDWQWSKLI